MSDESFNNNPNSSPPPGDQPANDAAMKIGDISDIADSHVNVAGGNLTQVHIEHAHFAAPLAPQPEPHPLPYHNLPRPDYACFVGREAELAWLRQRLHPSDRAWQIAITGIGGVGKSALALAIAHEYREKYKELPLEERFDAIIWISAKEGVLTAQGKETANLPETVLHTLEDVYTAIARALEREDITRASPEDQGRVVEKALKAQRTLLVMDNLESVQDERIKPFLRNLPSPAKALLTSRELPDLADVWRLKGLLATEADQLISEESTLRQVQLDTAQRQRVYDLTSGLPLPIKLAVARLSGGESFPAVERWLGDATGDLPEYCIAGQAELAKQRDPNAWKLLLVCSMFDRTAGASREALGYVTDLSIADRDQGLVQLQRLFLLNRTERDRFWVLPIVQRFAKEQITRSGETEIYVRKILNWLVSYVDARPYRIQRVAEWLDYIKIEYVNIHATMRLCITPSFFKDCLRLAIGSWNYPYITGLYRELEEILQITQQAVTSETDAETFVEVEIEIAKLASAQGRFQDVINHLIVAEKSALERNDAVQLDSIWSTYAYALYRQGRLQEAEEIALRAFNYNPDNLYLRYTGAYRLSAIETERGHFDEAERWLQLAGAAANELKGERRLRGVLHRRGNNLLAQGKYPEAESYLQEAFKIDVFLGDLRYQAADYLNLARVYQGLNRIAEAREFALKARVLNERLKIYSELEKADEFLRQLDQ